MLRQFPPQSRNENIEIISYSLVPGGLSRKDAAGDVANNNALSEIMLEAVKLLLGASLLGKSTETGDEPGDTEHKHPEPRLMEMIDRIRRSGEVRMGGEFPHLVARKRNQ